MKDHQAQESHQHRFIRAELEDLRSRVLATRDDLKLLAQFGFMSVSRPERIMELLTPNAFTSDA